MPKRSTRNPLKVQEMVRRRVRRRQLWRRARIGAVVTGVAVAVGGAAFGIDRMVVALTHYYGSPAHSSHPAVATTAAPTTTVASGPPACTATQLSGTVANWQANSTTTFETVSLTNLSTTACTLVGFPVIGANAQNGAALPAPTHPVAALGSNSSNSSSTAVSSTTASSTAPSSAPGQVSVAPGASGWFELDFPNVCSQVLNPGAAPPPSPGACYPGMWLQVTPPRTTSSLLINQPFRFDYGTAGFEVGPFEPGAPPASPPMGQ